MRFLAFEHLIEKLGKNDTFFTLTAQEIERDLHDFNGLPTPNQLRQRHLSLGRTLPEHHGPQQTQLFTLRKGKPLTITPELFVQIQQVKGFLHLITVPKRKGILLGIQERRRTTRLV